MHEETIAGVFEGSRDAAELNAEALRAIERMDDIRERIHVAPLGRPFAVTSKMLLRLCDAALSGVLQPLALRAVAFTVVTSEAFKWDEDIVGDILHDWSAPEVNLPLTVPNLHLFRAWLAGHEIYPERLGDLRESSSGQLLSETTRVTKRA